jgi:D-beta-D-heptose 7-phosphate kinase/D-beta-D-heptose 1-phosphate adenosyltransferase
VLLPPLPPDRARALIARFPAARILVVGDAMLDRFIAGRVTRISPEAPVPVVAFERETHRLGGAANVAHNVAAFGAQATLVAVTGQDDASVTLRDACLASGIDASLQVDSGRRTTTKVRIVTERNQQVARVDYESDCDVADEVEQHVVAAIHEHATRASVILMSDYLKGCVTRHVCEAALEAARVARIPLLVDPKIPHIDLYAGATLITPNHHEVEQATHVRVRSEEDAHRAARLFRDRARCDSVLMTRGDQGMWLRAEDVEGHLPAAAREVADVTGAGDTVIATIALALASGATLFEAARLANESAGIVVGRFGPATVTVVELLRALDASADV